MSRQRDDAAFQVGPGHPVTSRPARPRRWGWWAVLLAGVLGATAAAYLYLHPGLAPGWLRSLEVLPLPAPTLLYKWRDRAGTWQVTDLPPPAGVPFERLEYGYETNVLPIAPGAKARH